MYDGSVYMPLIHLTTHTFLSTLESTMDCWTDGRTCLFVFYFSSPSLAVRMGTQTEAKKYSILVFLPYTMATNDDDSVAGSCSTKMAHG